MRTKFLNYLLIILKKHYFFIIFYVLKGISFGLIVTDFTIMPFHTYFFNRSNNILFVLFATSREMILFHEFV